MGLKIAKVQKSFRHDTGHSSKEDQLLRNIIDTKYYMTQK